MYSLISNQKDEALLRMVVNTGVDLNKHMGKGSWYLFIPYDWPEGLALVLDHGADTEVQDAMGYTPIMRATRRKAGRRLKCCWPIARGLIIPATMGGRCATCCPRRSRGTMAKFRRGSLRFRRACGSGWRPVSRTG